ncbi:hypothetical protein SMICM17S_07581 [Streptomyces microflavus]
MLPAAVLGISQLPWFFLYIRQGVADALAEDPVRGARARGLSERTVLLGHALRSGMLPMLTLIGSRVPELITGALLVETVFSWPGIAAATVQAATSVDFSLLAALTVLATAAVLLGNLLSDLLYGLADPRVAFMAETALARPGRTTRRVRVVTSAVIVTVVALAVLVVPPLAQLDQQAVDLANKLDPPSLAHPFGTDDVGRDLLLRWRRRPARLLLSAWSPPSPPPSSARRSARSPERSAAGRTGS